MKYGPYTQEIRQLQAEARRIDKIGKDKVKVSGQVWLVMDEEDKANFKKFCEIQIKIAGLKDLFRNSVDNGNS